MAQGKTLKERLLQMLEENGERGVTELEWFTRTGHLRLAARVWELRDDGHPIVNTKRDDRDQFVAYVLRRADDLRPYIDQLDTVEPMSELELRFAWGDR
jgi:hypothetical protein